MYSNTLPPGRYAMHLRKSREDEYAESAGGVPVLTYHKQELERLAERLGIVIAPEDIYAEVVSGETLDARPECQRMLQAVVRGTYAGVLDVNLKRLTRGDMRDQGTILAAYQLSNTLIVTPERNYDLNAEDDRSIAEMSMMWGRMEFSGIRKQLMDGKMRRLKDGQYMAAKAPWGWRKIVLPDKRKSVEPDDNNPLGVRWFHEGVAGIITSVSSVVDDLNRRDVPSPQNARWTPSTWLGVMSNPVWKGYVRWNGKRVVQEMDDAFVKRKRMMYQEPEEFKGLHEGTVEPEVFDKFQVVFGIRKAPRTHTDLTLRNPLAGILMCAECGRAMRRRVAKGRARYDHSPANRHECWQQSAPMHVVVEEVVETLGEIVRDLEMKPGTDDAKRASVARVKELEEGVEECKKAIANLMRLAGKGLITDDEFADNRRSIDERKAELEEQLKIAAKEADEAMTAEERTMRLHEAMDVLGSDDATAEQQNAVLKSIIKRIDYTKNEAEGLRLKVFLR